MTAGHLLPQGPCQLGLALGFQAPAVPSRSSMDQIRRLSLLPSTRTPGTSIAQLRTWLCYQISLTRSGRRAVADVPTSLHRR